MLHHEILMFLDLVSLNAHIYAYSCFYITYLLALRSGRLLEATQFRVLTYITLCRSFSVAHFDFINTFITKL